MVLTTSPSTLTRSVPTAVSATDAETVTPISVDPPAASVTCSTVLIAGALSAPLAVSVSDRLAAGAGESAPAPRSERPRATLIPVSVSEADAASVTVFVISPLATCSVNVLLPPARR